MKKDFILEKKLDHIAFIMDGNGRWAKAKGLPRYLGHKEACNRLIEIFDTCMEFHIRYMSFYAFSTENWNRPQDEIDHLMDYLEEFFKKEIDYLDKKGTRILVSGDLGRIRKSTRNVCLDAIKRTENNNSFFLNICLNYGGRDEIVRASKKIALLYKEGKISLDDINEKSFRDYLWNPLLPDVDLMIRTSGEMRLSNFLLWQCAYAEFEFPTVLWPDFTVADYDEALAAFGGRERRFGKRLS